MTIMGNNSAGLLNKLDSFNRNIENFKPGVYFIQETKCRRKNQIKHDDYIMFEMIRKTGGGGGLLTAVHKSLSPVSVSEETEVEVLVVEGNIGTNKVRFINGYGPQEGPQEINSPFFDRLDFEIKSAQLAGTLICIELDANSKLGSKLIPGDPKEQSSNGKLLEKIVEDNDLIVVNGTELCEGRITRFRQTINDCEESIIDFFIVCRRFFSLVMSLLIDEKRIYHLTKYASKTGTKNRKESDHNNLIMKVNTSWDTNTNQNCERVEIYNYNNEEDFKMFQALTGDNEELVNCFSDTTEDFNTSCNKWLSIINSIIKKSFRKIRVNHKSSPNLTLDNLFKEKEILKTRISEFDSNGNLEESMKVTEELEKVDEGIADHIATKNKKIVEEHLGWNDDPLLGFNQTKMWKMKKKLAPKNTMDPPAAKKDQHGTLITDKSQLEKLYDKTYLDRLQPNKTVAGLEETQELQNYLFELRCEAAKMNVSDDWTEEDLEKVFKSLRNNKARDAHGHIYELFKYGGKDLKKSLLHFCNEVKSRQVYPEVLHPSNITSLYKNKGEKADLNNDRGIFNVVKIRSILDKLVYNEKYEVIDKNMSSSNIGGRKNRNIRDHLFVINAILHDASKDKKKSIDIEIYDIKKCFDKMWTQETSNDLYDVGVRDDHFILVANSNKSCQVAVKTPWGSLTERQTYSDIEMQGTVLTPIKCSVQIDTLGKELLAEDGNRLYKYKGYVRIPPLALIDDVLTISDCGINSVFMNAAVQSKVNNKRLELGHKKCSKMHIGGKHTACPKLMVHSEEMLTSSSEKYLGDILVNTGKIDENLKARQSKGVGIVNQIMGLLKEISFGSYFFQMALVFRNSQLINGTLFNMEALHGVNKKHLDVIEESDKMLFRNIFDCPQGTPLEAFFLETSTIPLRFILQGRRLMYLWTLLKKPKTELAREVYDAQKLFKTKGSWVEKVEEDLKSCEINLSDDEIQNLSQYKMSKLVKSKIREQADFFLLKMKAKHVKTEKLFPIPKMNDYLLSEELNTEEKRLLFKLRISMIPLKGNFSNAHSDTQCDLCEEEDSEETQIHLLQCSFIVNHPQLQSVIKSIKYNDIFENLSAQVKAVKVWKQILSVRKIKLGLNK